MDLAVLLLALFCSIPLSARTCRYVVYRPPLDQATVGIARGNHGVTAGVGPTADGADTPPALNSLLGSLISASSLFRGRARQAFDPVEG
jgi:hypothetical protein